MRQFTWFWYQWLTVFQRKGGFYSKLLILFWRKGFSGCNKTEPHHIVQMWLWHGWKTTFRTGSSADAVPRTGHLIRQTWTPWIFICGGSWKQKYTKTGQKQSLNWKLPLRIRFAPSLDSNVIGSLPISKGALTSIALSAEDIILSTSCEKLVAKVKLWLCMFYWADFHDFWYSSGSTPWKYPPKIWVHLIKK